MSCCSSDAATTKAVRLVLCTLGVAAGLVFILSLPEIKRYIRISSM
jgi:hypothetical protein